MLALFTVSLHHTATDTNTPAAITGLRGAYLTIQQRCLQYGHRLKHSKQLLTGYVRPTLQYNRDAFNIVADSNTPTAIDGLRGAYLTIQQRCLQYSRRLKHSNRYRRPVYVAPTLQYNRDAFNTVIDSNTPAAIYGLRGAYLSIQQRCLQYGHRLTNTPTAIDGLRGAYLLIQQRCLQYSRRLQHSNSYRRPGYVGPTLQYNRDAFNTVTDPQILQQL